METWFPEDRCPLPTSIAQEAAARTTRSAAFWSAPVRAFLVMPLMSSKIQYVEPTGNWPLNLRASFQIEGCLCI